VLFCAVFDGCAIPAKPDSWDDSGSTAAGVDAEQMEVDSAHGHLASDVDANKCELSLCAIIDKLEAKA
jgi:hypothetical protein